MNQFPKKSFIQGFTFVWLVDQNTVEKRHAMRLPVTHFLGSNHWNSCFTKLKELVTTPLAKVHPLLSSCCRIGELQLNCWISELVLHGPLPRRKGIFNGCQHRGICRKEADNVVGRWRLNASMTRRIVQDEEARCLHPDCFFQSGEKFLKLRCSYPSHMEWVFLNSVLWGNCKDERDVLASLGMYCSHRRSPTLALPRVPCVQTLKPDSSM